MWSITETVGEGSQEQPRLRAGEPLLSLCFSCLSSLENVIAKVISGLYQPQCESYPPRLLRALLLQLWEYHVWSFGRILSEKASTNSDVHAGLDVRRPMRQIKLYNPAELGSRKCSELS